MTQEMRAPEHKVFIFPMKLRWSDGAHQALETLKKDYPGLSLGVPSDTQEDFKIDISADILSIHTRKTMTLSSAGSFTLRFADRHRYSLDWRLQGGNKVSYSDNIQVNDVILIQLRAGTGKDAFENVMLGVVVRVSKETRVSGDNVEHSVIVEGSDLIRWLLMHRVFFWFYAIGLRGNVSHGINEVKRRFNPDKEIFKYFLPAPPMSSATEVLTNVLMGYIGAQLPWVKQIFTFIAEATESKRGLATGKPPLGLGETYVPMPDHTLDGFYGSVSQLLDRFAFRPFCEIWGDTGDDKFEIHFRRAPFDREDWYSFSETDSVRKLHSFKDADIVGIDTGKSEDEYCNFISVLPRFFQASETDLARLIMTHTYRLDWTAIKDRGYRPMIISTEYLDYIVSAQQSCLLDLQGADFSALVSGLKPTLLTPVDKMICASTSEHELQKFRQGNPKSLMVQRANAWVQILWDWFSILDRLWAGSITVAGSPAVKVGHKIGLANDTKHNFPLPMEFYVVGVSHNYDLERGLYLTTLNVTRGQPKDAFVTPSTNGVVDKIDAEQAKELGQIINKATHKKLEIQIERRPQP